MSKSRATEALLAELHRFTAEHLLNRLRSGEASPSEVANAIRFLKDNGIEAIPEKNDALQKIMEALPEFDSSEEDLTIYQ